MEKDLLMYLRTAQYWQRRLLGRARVSVDAGKGENGAALSVSYIPDGASESDDFDSRFFTFSAGSSRNEGEWERMNDRFVELEKSLQP